MKWILRFRYIRTKKKDNLADLGGGQRLAA